MIVCHECRKSLKALTHTHFKFCCTGRIKTLDEYKILYPLAETISEQITTKLAHSKESFIARYGEDLGKIKWKEYCDKLSKKNSLEYFLSKGKTLEEWKNYNKSRAVTLENQLKKHGIDGERRFNEYRKKQVEAGNSLNYFVKKYGEVEGQIKFIDVCKAKGITLENMIRVHGRELGFQKYNAWLEKTKGNYVSLVASQFVRDIVEYLPSDFIFHDGVFSREFCVWDNRAFLFDFVVTYPVMKAVEFNGDFWHANPAKYNEKDLIKIPGCPLLAEEIWKRDEIKSNVLKSRGFELLVVWESEYLSNSKETVKKVLEWLI